VESNRCGKLEYALQGILQSRMDRWEVSVSAAIGLSCACVCLCCRPYDVFTCGRQELENICLAKTSCHVCTAQLSCTFWSELGEACLFSSSQICGSKQHSVLRSPLVSSTSYAHMAFMNSREVNPAKQNRLCLNAKFNLTHASALFNPKQKPFGCRLPII